MIPIIYPYLNPSLPPTRPGALIRDIAPRDDRIPRDERVDLPEIQESFRVSFSENARTGSVMDLRDPLASLPAAETNPETARQLSFYRNIAAL